MITACEQAVAHDSDEQKPVLKQLLNHEERKERKDRLLSRRG